ncbi:FCD domain-containing protein [Brucellaceae bacterium D45D]
MAIEQISDDIERSRLKSLSQGVYRDLEQMIIEGQLGPGDRINEKALAEQRGISRGPIREACRRLEEAGFVKFTINRGFFVRVLDLKEIIEIYNIRAALFHYAGKILARRVTNEQLEELSDLHAQMQASIGRGDANLFYTLNRQFHSRIMVFTRNRRLAEIYEGLDKELHIWRKRALILDGNVQASSDEHGVILDLLRNGNASRLAEILRDHSLAGRNRLLRTMPDQLSHLQSELDDED